MGGNRSYYFVALIGAILLICLAIYALFFRGKDNKSESQSSSGLGGGATFFSGGESNISNNTTINQQNGGAEIINQSSSQSTTINNNTEVSNVSGGRGSNITSNSILTNEIINKNLITKKGDTLGFSPTSVEDARSMPAIDIPGFSSGNYSPMSRSTGPIKAKVCLVVMETINREVKQINSLDEGRKLTYLLDRLRNIPSFGAISEANQKFILDGIVKDLASKSKIEVFYYCDLIEKMSQNNPTYEQCLRILDGIIISKIIDKNEIDKRLGQMTSWKMLEVKDKNEIIQMIIDGLKAGNLSKEKICSLIMSKFLEAWSNTLLFQQCIIVMQKISAISNLNHNLVDTYLQEIPGYKFLLRKWKDDIIQGILDDPRLPKGELDIEMHCLKIVEYIQKYLEGNAIYQQCMKVLDVIARTKVTTDASLITKLLKDEIPGFIILASEIQEKAVSAILSARNDGTLSDERVRMEICRNITLAILEALSSNALYQKCIDTINVILDSGNGKDKAYIMKEMIKNMPFFNQFPIEKQNYYVGLIYKVDILQDKDHQVSEICLSMVADIIGLIQNSQLYKQCIVIMDAIIKDNITSRAEIKERIEKLSGFLLIRPKEIQDKHIDDIVNAVQKGILEKEKEAICIRIVSSIMESLYGNDIYTKCISVIQGIIDSGKLNDKKYILAQLMTIPGFERISPANQSKYINYVMALAPNAAKKELADEASFVRALKNLIKQKRASDITDEQIISALKRLSGFEYFPPSVLSRYSKKIHEFYLDIPTLGEDLAKYEASSVSRSATPQSKASPMGRSAILPSSITPQIRSLDTETAKLPSAKMAVPQIQESSITLNQAERNKQAPLAQLEKDKPALGRDSASPMSRSAILPSNPSPMGRSAILPSSATPQIRSLAANEMSEILNQVERERQALLAQAEKDKQAALVQAVKDSEYLANLVAINFATEKQYALAQAEKDKQAALAQAEKDKQAALAQAEKDKQAALLLAEKDKQAALAQAEKDKQAALAQAEKDKQAALAQLAIDKEKALADALNQAEQDKQAALAQAEKDKQGALARAERDKQSALAQAQATFDRQQADMQAQNAAALNALNEQNILNSQREMALMRIQNFERRAISLYKDVKSDFGGTTSGPLTIEEICMLIAIEIEGLGPDNAHKQCIRIIQGILASNRDNFDSIKMELMRIPAFKQLNSIAQEKYINSLMALGDGENADAQIGALCQAMEDEANYLNQLSACAKEVVLLVTDRNQTDISYVRTRMSVITDFNRLTEDRQDNVIEQIGKIPNISKGTNGKYKDEDYTSTIKQAIKICQDMLNQANIESENAGGGTSVNMDRKKTPQKTPTVPNSVEFDKGKCSILNAKVADAYKAYVQTLPTFPNLLSSESIDTINNSLPDDEYYIPVEFVDIVEQGVVNDFLATLDQEPEKARFTNVAQALYNNLGERQSPLNIVSSTAKVTFISRLYRDMAFLMKYQFTEDKLNDYILEVARCTNRLKDIDDWRIASQKMQNEMEGKRKSMQGLEQNFITGDENVIPEADDIIFSSQEFTSCNKELSSFASGLYGGKYVNSLNSKKAHVDLQAAVDRIMGIKSVSEDSKDFIKTITPSLILECQLNSPRCETAREGICSQVASKIILERPFKVKNPPTNLSSKNKNEPTISKKLTSSIQYSECIKHANKSIQSNIANGFSAHNFNQAMPGYKELDDSWKQSYIEKGNELIVTCKGNDKGQACVTEKNELCRSMAFGTLKKQEDSPSSIAFSVLSGCSSPMPTDVSPTEREVLNLGLDSQKQIVRNGWKLMQDFQVSAKTKRRQLIEGIWNATASNKGDQVPSKVCQDLAYDIWGTYNEDNLKDVLGNPLDEILEELDKMLLDLETGDLMKDFTAPPSEKCKCHLEQMYKKLHNAKIDNFEVCQSNESQQQNLAFAKISASKYLASREATIAELPQDATQTNHKAVCNLVFRNILNIAQDTGELRKFGSNDVTGVNKITMRQICVQQLRDIYHTVALYKEQYFKQGETFDKSCDQYKDN